MSSQALFLDNIKGAFLQIFQLNLEEKYQKIHNILSKKIKIDNINKKQII